MIWLWFGFVVALLVAWAVVMVCFDMQARKLADDLGRLADALSRATRR